MASRTHLAESRMAAQRIKRLKDLVDMLERLPPSPDRDRVLSEVRSRAVDLDTGVTPRAMLPVREPSPPPVTPKLPVDERLSMEDSPLPYVQAKGDRAVLPWMFGLRA